MTRNTMWQAILEHHKGVVVVGELMRAVGEQETQLQESIDELKRLVMEQGSQLRAHGAEIRALRERLNGHQ
jgi:hypothetical protein